MSIISCRQEDVLPACVDLCLTAPSAYAPQARAARAQQREPDHRAAGVAGLRKGVRPHEHRKDDVVGRQLLRAVRVGKELAAALARAAVVFDIAVLLVGRLLARHKRQGMLRGNR